MAGLRGDGRSPVGCSVMRDMPEDLGSGLAKRQEADVALPTSVARPAIELRLQVPKTAPLFPSDIAFLISYGFTPDDLAAARDRGAGLRIPAHRALIGTGKLTEAVYVHLLARRLGIGLATRDLAPVDRVTLAEALRQGWFRARRADGNEVLVLHASGPLVAAVLETPTLHRRDSLRFADTALFHEILRERFAGAIARAASEAVPLTESARQHVTSRQWIALYVGLAALLSCAVLAPQATLVLAPLALGLFFLASALVQLAACFAGYARIAAPVERRDTALPHYSILVPLHREAAVVADLVSALSAIDYPPEKLQILLVTEAHDSQTQAAINALSLPSNIAMFVAPPGTPHTKPRAINAAMPFVTGDLVVVYDAEDRPDPRQLRAAVAAFARAPRNVVCLQARLAIDNFGDSWLTRMFAIEYAALFDVVKAGTARLGLPVPLGGTSNHFRADALRSIGLWDAWNVTEDADLGFRLALHGLAVQDLDSTTDEEAPVHLTAWLHQRSRWLKGWMQTILTHSRAPVRAWRVLGSINFFAAIAQSAGVIIGAVGAPVFHTLVLLRMLSEEPLGSGPLLHQLADAVIVVLGIAGLMCTFLPALIGIARRKLWHLLPWLPFLPIYQLLVSVAAYRAAFELIRSPFSWNKTTHGKARNRIRRPL